MRGVEIPAELCSSEVRSVHDWRCPGGAGSDVVGSMSCRAEKKGDRWVANGNKM